MKRCFVIAIALILAFSLFAACNKAADDPEDITQGLDTAGQSNSTPSIPVPITPENTTPPEDTSDKPDDTGETGKSDDDKPEDDTPAEAAPEHPFTNPLTGEGCDIDYSQYRPFGVMINNVRPSMPQVGVSAADILFEVLVESNCTRCEAIFHDISLADAIGSIRSCRPYYVHIALALDAIYVHAGGSTEGIALIQSTDCTHINALSSSHFYRDEWRSANLAYEHSLMLDTQEVIAGAEEDGYRRTHEDGFDNALTFAETPQLSEPQTASSATICFGYKTTQFDYDAETGLYGANQYEKQWIDGGTDEQLKFRNLVFLKADTRLQSDGVHLTIKMVDENDGWFFVDGKCVEITWKRESEYDQFHFFYKDGTPVDLGVGKTYVGIYPGNGYVEYE